MRNPELVEDLAAIEALASAIAGLAALVPADAVEPALYQLVLATRDAYAGLIERAEFAGLVEAEGRRVEPRRGSWNGITTR
jgi:hypothetical protein